MNISISSTMALLVLAICGSGPSVADCLCSPHYGGLTDPGGGADPFVPLTLDPARAGAGTGNAAVHSNLTGPGRCKILPECSQTAVDCRFDFTVTVTMTVDPLFPPSKVQFRDGSKATFNSNGVATSDLIFVDDVDCGDTRHFWLKIRNAANQVMGGADILLICDNCQV